jgi:hypothetical protein
LQAYHKKKFKQEQQALRQQRMQQLRGAHACTTLSPLTLHPHPCPPSPYSPSASFSTRLLTRSHPPTRCAQVRTGRSRRSRTASACAGSSRRLHSQRG